MPDIDKQEDRTLISRLEPKTLRYIRKLNIGNYENIDIGGEFFVPEGMTIEEAQIAILEYTEREVERWVEATQKKPYTRDHSHLLENYQDQLAEYKGESANLVDEKLARAQISTVIKMIDEFRDLVKYNLNSKIESLFTTLGALFVDSKVSKEDFDLPDAFSFVIQDETKPEPGPDESGSEFVGKAPLSDESEDNHDSEDDY